MLLRSVYALSTIAAGAGATATCVGGALQLFPSYQGALGSAIPVPVLLKDSTGGGVGGRLGAGASGGLRARGRQWSGGGVAPLRAWARRRSARSRGAPAGSVRIY